MATIGPFPFTISGTQGEDMLAGVDHCVCLIDVPSPYISSPWEPEEWLSSCFIKLATIWHYTTLYLDSSVYKLFGPHYNVHQWAHSIMSTNVQCGLDCGSSSCVHVSLFYCVGRQIVMSQTT